MLYCFAKLVYCIQCDLNSEQAVPFAKDFRGCILIGRIFPECTGLQRPGRRGPFTSTRPRPVLTAAILCRDRRKCLSCQGQVSDGAWQTPDNQYTLALKDKPPGEVVDQLLIPTQVKLYRVHVNVRHISAMSICNFYQNFIIFATGLGQLIPRCIR